MTDRPSVIAPEFIVLGAFRYALGRQSHIVWDTQQYIRHCWPYLSDNTKRVIKRDIREAEAWCEKGAPWSGLGDKEIDASGWLAILELDGPDV